MGMTEIWKIRKIEISPSFIDNHRDDPEFTEAEAAAMAKDPIPPSRATATCNLARPEQCQCGQRCPKMPNDVEQKCCLGKVASVWKTKYDGQGQ